MQTVVEFDPQSLSDEELKRLWQQVGRNLSHERLALLHKGGEPDGLVEAAFVGTLSEMQKRKLPLS